jgi:hypothetical protein
MTCILAGCCAREATGHVAAEQSDELSPLHLYPAPPPFLEGAVLAELGFRRSHRNDGNMDVRAMASTSVAFNGNCHLAGRRMAIGWYHLRAKDDRPVKFPPGRASFTMSASRTGSSRSYVRGAADEAALKNRFEARTRQVWTAKSRHLPSTPFRL